VALAFDRADITNIVAPHSCVLRKGGYEAANIVGFIVPNDLHRTCDTHHLHFIS
jgi:hypothetical protein